MELQALLQRGAVFNPAPATGRAPGFQRWLAHFNYRFPKSLTTLHMKLLAWRPSGYAEFSIPNASNFLITCSGINVVAFRVYSISPGQFMNLFLALSLKSSWESQNEDRQSKIQVRLFNFLPGGFHILLVGRTVTIKCCHFTQPICKWKPLESIKYLDNGEKPRDSFKVTFTCII